MSTGIQRFVPKRPLQSAHLNQLVDGVNGVYPITGSNGVNVGSLGGVGSTITLDDDVFKNFSPIIGKIVAEGPNGEADFTDYRYWVHVQWNLNTSANNDLDKELDIQDKDEGEAIDYIIPVFNPVESKTGTHELAVDEIVFIAPVRFDKGGEAAPRVRFAIVKGGSESKGQHQWQQSTMVSANQRGWSFNRVHALLE